MPWSRLATKTPGHRHPVGGVRARLELHVASLEIGRVRRDVPRIAVGLYPRSDHGIEFGSAHDELVVVDRSG